MTQTLALEPLEQIDDRGLVAACDVLVLRALELVGKRIVRADRSRFGRMGETPFHEAHVYWQPDAEMLEKSLATAWTFLPQIVSTHGMPHVSSKQVEFVLDRYVRDLVSQMRAHDVQDLRYCLKAFT